MQDQTQKNKTLNFTDDFVGDLYVESIEHMIEQNSQKLSENSEIETFIASVCSNKKNKKV